MNSRSGMLQMAFIFCIILIIAVLGFMGFAWLESRMGWQMSFAMFIMFFVVSILFLQQYLTGLQAQATIKNMNDFSEKDAKTDAYRQATLLETAKGMRNVMTIDAKATASDQRLLEDRAATLAQVMSKAQIEAMKAKLLGGEVTFGENDTLD